MSRADAPTIRTCEYTPRHPARPRQEQRSRGHRTAIRTPAPTSPSASQPPCTSCTRPASPPSSLTTASAPTSFDVRAGSPERGQLAPVSNRATASSRPRQCGSLLLRSGPRCGNGLRRGCWPLPCAHAADWSTRRNCRAHPTSHRPPAAGTRAKTHGERPRRRTGRLSPAGRDRPLVRLHQGNEDGDPGELHGLTARRMPGRRDGYPWRR